MSVFDDVIAHVVGSPQNPLRRFDQHVDALAVARRDRQANSTDRSVRKSGCMQCAPRRAAVGRFVDSVAVAAAVEMPGGAAEAPHPREEHVGMLRITHHVRRADTRPRVERLRPRRSPIERAEDAAFGAVGERIAERGDDDAPRIARIDQHARDLRRARQPHLRPRLTAVGRMVDPVARDHVVARPRFAGPHPHIVFVLRRDRDRADRLRRLAIEDRTPIDPAVRRLPHAAASRARVEEIRIGVRAGDRGDASARNGRPDVAPLQGGRRRRGRTRRGTRAYRSARRLRGAGGRGRGCAARKNENGKDDRYAMHSYLYAKSAYRPVPLARSPKRMAGRPHGETPASGRP